MRQQGSDGAKLRQPHSHRHPVISTHQESEDVAFTTPAHDQESEDVYVVDQ